MDFNKFVKKTKEATISVGKKANDLVEITKINLEIVDLENDIDDLYKEIGIFVFNSYKNGTEIPESIKDKCKIIEEKSLKVMELKQKHLTISLRYFVRNVKLKMIEQISFVLTVVRKSYDFNKTIILKGRDCCLI
jgi:hypothetical protein